MFLFRKTPIVKLSQFGHSAAYCMGGMWLQLSWLSYLGPITEKRCLARPWTVSLAYSLMFGALVRKIFVVMSVLDKNRNIQTSGLSRRIRRYACIQWGSLYFVVGCLLIDIIIMIPWMEVSPPIPQTRYFDVPLVGSVPVENYTCGSKYSDTFTFLIVAYKVMLTIVGAVFAFRVRSLGTLTDHSWHIILHL
jgi:hypothetical protein